MLDERTKLMQACRREAVQRLTHLHIDEFHSILEQVYEERGIQVKKRLVGERKLRADIEAAKKLLAEHGEIAS